MPITPLLEYVLEDPLRVFVYGYGFHLARYLILAGGAYVLFYLLFRRWMARRKVQPARPGRVQMRREVALSMVSFVVFAATGVATVAMQRRGWAMPWPSQRRSSGSASRLARADSSAGPSR